MKLSNLFQIKLMIKRTESPKALAKRLSKDIAKVYSASERAEIANELLRNIEESMTNDINNNDDEIAMLRQNTTDTEQALDNLAKPLPYVL